MLGFRTNLHGLSLGLTRFLVRLEVPYFLKIVLHWVLLILNIRRSKSFHLFRKISGIGSYFTWKYYLRVLLSPFNGLVVLKIFQVRWPALRSAREFVYDKILQNLILFGIMCVLPSRT